MCLTVVILTKDEEKHIERAIASVAGIAGRIVVVDSGSRDRTCELARRAGATVLEHPWVNYASQFNWALDALPEDTDWVLRLDADEVVTPELARQITDGLGAVTPDVQGLYVSRRMCFLRRPIRWGGIFPIRVLRIFRRGAGRCEERWMDEHVLVKGRTDDLSGEIVDDNLNPLGWWTDKHNSYAAREVVDLLNLKHRFSHGTTAADLGSGRQDARKRWIKENIYARLPAGLRAFVYLLYRLVFRLGFLDGREGVAFHVLQGFWYRYLVDAKLFEVEQYMKREGVSVTVAIRDVLGIDVDGR